jgi:uncharacterized membrane protein YbhN (UPF0104 family)
MLKKYLLFFFQLVLLLALLIVLSKQIGTWSLLVEQWRIIAQYNAVLTYGLISTVILLSVLNYLVEARRWQFLLQHTLSLSLLAALQSVLAGISLGIITPNRVGEFGGRVLTLPQQQAKAALIMVVGQLAQLIVTLGASAIGFVYYMYKQPLLPIWTIQVIMAGSVVAWLLLVTIYYWGIVYLPKVAWLKRWITVKDTLQQYTKKELQIVLLWSLLRWVIYVVQYMLLLAAFGIKANSMMMIGMICSSYFAQTLLPTFGLVEIGVRGNVAVFFAQNFSTSPHSAVLLASIMLWCINLGVPALLGWFFLSKSNTTKAKL